MIKLSIWIYALAATVASWASVVYGQQLENMATRWETGYDQKLAYVATRWEKVVVGDSELWGITEFFCHIQWRIFYLTVPILLVALALSCRRSTDARHALVFSGMVTLFLVLLVSLAAFASAAPFMNLVVQYKPL